jgi:protein-S-isoprenylcysteine O-methyltransferase Ste14
MDEPSFYRMLLAGTAACAVLTFVALFFVTAPYGRHESARWGPTIDNRTGWLIMESPSSIVFFACWLAGGHPTDLSSLVFLSLWELHYVHRAFVFPFRMKGAPKRMPALIAALAFLFTSINGYLNGRWLFGLGGAGRVGLAWASDPRFALGVALFLVGFALNQHADWVLLNLRKPGETGYKIPQGGLYRWVSSPNYLGEIVEWSGWALATFSAPGLLFAVWTVANLLPRALSHHRWYQTKFPDYPPERKALLPGLL